VFWVAAFESAVRRALVLSVATKAYEFEEVRIAVELQVICVADCTEETVPVLTTVPPLAPSTQHSFPTSAELAPNPEQSGPKAAKPAFTPLTAV
jgi:hypothetical protein